MATNGTTTADAADEAPEIVYNSYTTADFFIGLAITLCASTLQAFGLNITKLDHLRNAKVPRSQRKADYLRVSRQTIKRLLVLISLSSRYGGSDY